jgi:photosystem II stability/assembly factor-like uncharacterized protein
MKKLVLTTLIYFLIANSSFSQWEYQNPKPTGGQLNSVQFVDSLNGWTVGDKAVLHTINGGLTWEYQHPGYLNGRSSLYFTDLNNGWVTGGNNIIYHTADGGQTWIDQPWTSGSETEYLNKLFFIDPNHGWAVGSAQDDGFPSNNMILNTYNGGATWQLQYKVQGSCLNGVFFSDLLNGWAVGYGGLILHTTNGGQTWSQQPSGSNNITLWDVYFINELTGWASGFYFEGSHHGYVLHTSDGGNSWQVQFDELNVSFYGICFATEQKGWVVGGSNIQSNGLIYQTTNGGVSWNFSAGDSVYSLMGINTPDALHLWATGDKGSIMYSSDGGSTWAHLDHRVRLAVTDFDRPKISFSDSLHGWIAGSDSALLQTANGGRNWQRLELSSGQRFYSVSFIDSLNGWAIAGSLKEKIMKTIDGGQSWQLQYTGTNERFDDIFFIDHLSGWVSGYNGLIKNTVDGGNTWTTQYSSPNTELVCLHFVDQLHGWAVGGSIYQSPGIILNTNNGGISWDIQYMGSYFFNGACFSDPQHGWAVNYFEYYKTTDGGLNWDKIGNNLFGMYSISCSDPKHIYIAGEYGCIQTSLDGGLTWMYPQNLTANLLQSIIALDSSNIYTFGIDAVILHTNKDGEILVGTKDINPIVNTNTLQSIVFPNPASNTINLSISLEYPEVVEIDIFDLLGINIYHRNYCLQPAGKSSFIIDISRFKPGLYICESKAGDKRKSMKIVVENK